MKISVNSVRKMMQRDGCGEDIAPDGVEALARRIGAQLGAIEEIIDVGAKYQGVLIVKIVSCDDHPNADRLHVCKVDDGGKAQGVERDEQGYVQVICGAPNVRAGLTVAWLPPGSTVPESVGKDPFVLEARALRGVISNGMLASPRELALGDSHEGILEIDEEVAPGSDFAEHFNLAGDAIFDIENKMFTHRPDCFGTLGVARELAGIQSLRFKSPAWYRTDAVVPSPETELLPLTVRNELPELVPRFTMLAMRDVAVGPSPIWLQVELAKVGLRSINNIVDLTNYYMLLTGQPLHAYDYDKVKALSQDDTATIVVRQPQADETINLLNGKKIEPRSEAIMIATDQTLIGVGGVMGGADAEVDGTTRHILLEAANFDMYSIRRTSMAHGLFTDAVSRFNKGQSPLQNRAIIAKIVDDIQRLAQGKVASELVDITSAAVDEALQRGSLHAPVSVEVLFINERLGLSLTTQEVVTLLTNVEFDVVVSQQSDGDNLIVKAPFWRTDIEIKEDVVEEVGRLYGFDHLPLELPSRPTAPAGRNHNLALKQQVRDALSQAGANELLGYSFVHGKLLERVGQQPEQAYKISNALSPDLQYYRLSLTPSLLDKVHANIKAGYDQFALFELGKSHAIGFEDGDKLPQEFERLSLVFAADPKASKQYAGAAYYQAYRYLSYLLQALHSNQPIQLRPLDDNQDTATAYYEPGRAASIMAGDKLLGRIGEYRASVRKALKLPEYCAGFEISTDVLAQLAGDVPYAPLSRYPKVEQDICLKVAVALPYAEILEFVAAEMVQRQPDYRWSLHPVDIYQRQDDPDYKQITLRLSVVSYDKTLRDTEVAALLDEVAQAAAKILHAQRV
jgi:phenylalanyl-tRNA synthetase beta chain